MLACMSPLSSSGVNPRIRALVQVENKHSDAHWSPVARTPEVALSMAARPAQAAKPKGDVLGCGLQMRRRRIKPPAFRYVDGVQASNLESGNAPYQVAQEHVQKMLPSKILRALHCAKYLVGPCIRIRTFGEWVGWAAPEILRQVAMLSGLCAQQGKWSWNRLYVAC